MKAKQKISLLMGILVAALMLFIVFLPMRADAATIKKLSSGSTTALQHSGGDKYTITLSQDALLRFDWSANNSGRTYFSLYKNSDYSGIVYSFSPDTVSGTKYYALAAGTYYINMYDGYSSSSIPAQAKIKYLAYPSKNVNKDNYCRAKAETVAMNTYVKAAQTFDYNYTRWYKIYLGSSRKIVINLPYGGNYEYKILTAKLNNVATSYESNKKRLVTQDAQLKGTYYICVSTGADEIEGTPIVFQWH